ncbi:MAG TPA: aminotransferase class IV [Cellulomonas sp.]
MTSVLWADGRLRDPDEPVVAGTDPAFTTGLGLFETCAVRDGRAFALSRHLDRLAASLVALGLPPLDEQRARDGVRAVLSAAGAGTGRLRVTAGGGSASALVVSAGPAPVRGVPHVVRVPWVRNERSPLAGHKSTSYAADVLALAAAVRAGGDEAVLADSTGALCEGTTSNLLVERDGEVLTPALRTGCLPGVTRALVLAWSAEAGLPVREARPGELPWTVLDDVAAGRAGLALTGSLRGVAAVGLLDGRAVPPAAVLVEVARLFDARSAQDLDP